MPNPVYALEIAKYHLRDGGILVIEVPSVYAPHFLLYKITGIKWFVLPPMGIIYSHIGYYSPRSLRFLVKRVGFNELKLITARWHVRASGVLSKLTKITDPVIAFFKIGGILWIGKKEK